MLSISITFHLLITIPYSVRTAIQNDIKSSINDEVALNKNKDDIDTEHEDFHIFIRQQSVYQEMEEDIDSEVLTRISKKKDESEEGRFDESINLENKISSSKVVDEDIWDFEEAPKIFAQSQNQFHFDRDIEKTQEISPNTETAAMNKHPRTSYDESKNKTFTDDVSNPFPGYVPCTDIIFDTSDNYLENDDRSSTGKAAANPVNLPNRHSHLIDRLKQKTEKYKRLVSQYNALFGESGIYTDSKHFSSKDKNKVEDDAITDDDFLDIRIHHPPITERLQESTHKIENKMKVSPLRKTEQTEGKDIFEDDNHNYDYLYLSDQNQFHTQESINSTLPYCHGKDENDEDNKTFHFEKTNSHSKDRLNHPNTPIPTRRSKLTKTKPSDTSSRQIKDTKKLDFLEYVFIKDPITPELLHISNIKLGSDKNSSFKKSEDGEYYIHTSFSSTYQNLGSESIRTIVNDIFLNNNVSKFKDRDSNISFSKKEDTELKEDCQSIKTVQNKKQNLLISDSYLKQGNETFERYASKSIGYAKRLLFDILESSNIILSPNTYLTSYLQKKINMVKTPKKEKQKHSSHIDEFIEIHNKDFEIFVCLLSPEDYFIDDRIVPSEIWSYKMILRMTKSDYGASAQEKKTDETRDLQNERVVFPLNSIDIKKKGFKFYESQLKKITCPNKEEYRCRIIISYTPQLESIDPNMHDTDEIPKLKNVVAVSKTINISLKSLKEIAECDFNINANIWHQFACNSWE